jgi:signal transduction histidine kinase
MAVRPTDQDTDPRWRKLVRLAVHEFRNPLGVVVGYVRMLNKETVGPLTDQQQRFLEEVEKSCNRMSALLREVHDVSNLESGTTVFTRSTVAIAALLAEVIADLPPPPYQKVTVELSGDPALRVYGDAKHLKSAFSAILTALRRELVAGNRLAVVMRPRPVQDGIAIHITVGDPSRMEQLQGMARSELSPFDEWDRGGLGLSLPAASRIIEAHGGWLLAPSDDGKAAAVISIPGV